MRKGLGKGLNDLLDTDDSDFPKKKSPSTVQKKSKSESKKGSSTQNDSGTNNTKSNKEDKAEYEALQNKRKPSRYL